MSQTTLEWIEFILVAILPLRLLTAAVSDPELVRSADLHRRSKK
jgi:hypothetical protein